MMDGEKESEGHRPGSPSLAAMLFGEEKRRTSSMFDDESLFPPPSPAPNASSGEECRSRTGSLTDLLDRPPESALMSLGAINEWKKEGREKFERKEENRGDEEEQGNQNQKPYNVDDKNVNDGKKELGEEEEDQEQESEVLEQEEAVHGSHIRRYQKRFSFREVRHFPPPIPLLAQTGNLPCHMPWILKRTYKNDGRLVLREVNLKHHEFFRAHRSNGRLTLQVVHFEDASRRARRPDLHSGEEDESSTTENDPPPSPASPRSSSSPPLISPPPPSDRDEKGTTSTTTTIHEILNAESTPSIINSLDSPSSVSSRNEEIIDDRSITTTTTNSLENVNAASMGNIVSGCFANSLLQMPIRTIRPIHS